MTDNLPDIEGGTGARRESEPVLIVAPDGSIPSRIDGAVEYVPVTKANSDLSNGVCRALLVGTAGTANLTQPDGTERDGVPLQEGYNPIQALQVRTGGDADDIWALY